ncbi:hypothetical protein ABZV65_30385 [Streptomyces bauhiniae]|uniref:hypothetical protein n=1 Tax=Streptomyces bauhiniae TaxID=2340725 RepID=UPI0033A21A14
MSSAFENDRIYTTFETTESPETGECVPVVISWWYHDDPDSPTARRGAAQYRGFIRHTRMHEHMRHYLSEGGERTRLELRGRRFEILRHPLTAALADSTGFPSPDPVPDEFGQAVVGGDVGMYVLVADPLTRPPTLPFLMGRVSEDGGGVGMARFELHADDEARAYYGSLPQPGLPETFINRVAAEPDAGLRSALQFVFGIPGPGSDRI